MIIIIIIIIIIIHNNNIHNNNNSLTFMRAYIAPIAKRGIAIITETNRRIVGLTHRAIDDTTFIRLWVFDGHTRIIFPERFGFFTVNCPSSGVFPVETTGFIDVFHVALLSPFNQSLSRYIHSSQLDK